ncbi:hypothetical protein BGZ98_004608, partial [Dissophora globulifera]
RETGLRGYRYVFDVLNDFYGSTTLKNMKWERQKAVRAISVGYDVISVDECLTSSICSPLLPAVAEN